MANATCSIDGCEKPVKSLGWCSAHYMRWRRAHPELQPAPYSFDERLEARIERDREDGCWIWRGSLTSEGYGQVKRDRRNLLVHRLIYERVVGPIPDGRYLDHLCRVRSCCNPEHLEPVTNKENVLRGVGPSAKNAVKTHCKHGHEFTAENTHVRPNGDRMCRACSREGQRRARSYRS